MKAAVARVLALASLAVAAIGWGAQPIMSATPERAQAALPSDGLPPPPKLKDLPSGQEGAQIRYGLQLVANSAEWFGPKGKLHVYAQGAKSRMACRNCHLDSGLRPLGNSWLDTFQLYPQYRAREGIMQTLADRINTCIEHPMQGQPLPVDSKEMKAMIAYYRWIGRNRPVLWRDLDNRLPKIEFLTRAANPEKGRQLFSARCAQCHGSEGQGKLRADGVAFIFPPLWGKESFMTGSSMSRVSVLARFIRGNMPLGATADAPLVTEEEAWDLAAFVDAQDRPGWTSKAAFPHNKEKPYDFPIGPYEDEFSPEQHHFGPFQPIIDYWKSHGEAVVVDPTGI